MNELITQIQRLIERVKDLETALYRIQTIVFPTDRGRLSIPKYETDPTSPVDGDIWYNETTNKFRGRANGSSVDLH